jgi:hypothetical protein
MGFDVEILCVIVCVLLGGDCGLFRSGLKFFGLDRVGWVLVCCYAWKIL